MKPLNKLFSVTLLSIALTACGGNFDTTSSNFSLSGIGSYFNATTVGSTCKLHQGDENGAQLGGDLITDKDGMVSFDGINVPVGIVTLECEGGEYIDEATGVLVVTAPRSLAATNYDGSDTLILHVSPISNIAYNIAIATNNDLSGIDALNISTAEKFGVGNVNIVKFLPSDLNNGPLADSTEDKIGYVLAALSQLDSGTPGSASDNTNTETEADDLASKIITAFEDIINNGNADNSNTEVTPTDVIDPTIEGFSSTTADGNYKAGEVINITATASESIQAGNTITVLLNTGGSATLTAAADGRTLVGNYTVLTGDNSSDLTVMTFVAGTVLDNAGRALTSTTLPTTNIAQNSAIVIDTTAPVITLNGASVINLFVGDSYTDLGAIASDNIDATVTVVTAGDTVNTALPGTYTVTYNATDSAGNAATEVTRMVVVIADTTAPVITLTGVSPINLPVGDTYVELGATVTDNADTNVQVVTAGDTVNTALPSIYIVTYNATDSSGNVATEVTRTVLVADTTAPIITLIGDSNTTVEVGDVYTDLGATATDNLDATVTVITVGDNVNTATLATYTVTYNAIDNAGNLATEVTRTVEVVDTTAPVITLNGNSNITVEVGDVYTDLGATATDILDGNVTVVVAGDNVDTAVLGAYIVTYNAIDNAGNAATEETRTVTVVDTTAPILAEVIPVPTPTSNDTPSYTFNSDEAGDITYGGSCPSAITAATVGDNTITFNALGDATFNDCTITVTDISNNISNPLTVTTFVVDSNAPTITEVTPVTTPASDDTPDYTFNTSEAGNLTYGGSCSSSTTTATVGDNTITFNALGDGTFIDCTITITNASNSAAALSVSEFVIDTTGPVLSEVTAVPTPSNDTTPEYTFISDEAGTIIYGGDCGNATPATAVAGNNIITYDSVTDGIHSNCTIMVTDNVGNPSTVLAVSSFIIDTVAPVITIVNSGPFVTVEAGDAFITPAATLMDNVQSTGSVVINDGGLNNFVPGIYIITFNGSDLAGNPAIEKTVTVTVVDTTAPVITLTGDAIIIIGEGLDYVDLGATATDIVDGTLAVVPGGDIVDTAVLGIYSVTYNVTDNAGNVATEVTRMVRVIDIAHPILREVTAVPTPSRNTSPQYTFDSNEAGTITYTGDCSSSTNVAVVGDNAITFNTLTEGTYSNCVIIVADATGNSTNLTVTPFTIDTTNPILAEVTVVPTPANDVNPSYTFNSSEIGDIAINGDCSSSTLAAVAGNNTITFNTLSEGTYNCTILITDGAGNLSNFLSITPFTIDTTAPVIAEVIAIPTPGNNSTADYTFSSNEAGEIIGIAGTCAALTYTPFTVIDGNNTVTFSGLPDGIHNDCTISIIDSVGNLTDLVISAFSVDTLAPVIAEVTPIPTPSNDNTPEYTFSSNEEGSSISLMGTCASATITPTTVIAGSNTITFSTLSDATYSDCQIVVFDNLGNGSTLAISEFAIDTVAPVISEVTAITSQIGNTPEYTFNSSKIGDITYGGDCSSSTTTAVVGDNTINFNALVDGIYNNCTISIIDTAGNPSNDLVVSEFTLDTTGPILIEITRIPTPTNDNTPEYTFSSNEAASVSLTGNCGSATLTPTTAIAGNNTITFSALAEGTYSSCRIVAFDSQSNSSLLPISEFTIDTTNPILAEVTVVPTPANDVNPSYTFNSSEIGDITYGGGCSSSSTAAVMGNNTVTFNTLSEGTYNCTILLTDGAGNPSNLVSITPFTIDTTAPVIAEVTAIPTPNALSDAQYTFSSNEAGRDLEILGTCSSGLFLLPTVIAGNNIINITGLPDGIHNDCTISIIDTAGNPSNDLVISAFTIDTIGPVLTEVTPIPTPSNDNTPEYIFSSNEAGDIIKITGSCASGTVAATLTPTAFTAGDNTITFSTLADGTYSNCAFLVQDELGFVAPFAISEFTIDTVAPVISEETAITTPTNDNTPDYSLRTDENGTISYSGDCNSNTVPALVDVTVITFNLLGEGLHDNCTITVTDSAGNPSNVLAIPAFTVDTNGPILTEVTPIPTSTNDNTPEYTFSSDEAGDITQVLGSCASAFLTPTRVNDGNNTVTFSTLLDATYSDCRILVFDDLGNGETLSISEFAIDTSTPSLAGTPIVSPTSDNTPDYTFTSSEEGVISYDGDCTSITTAAVIGVNIITFNPLAEGLINCSVTVTDSAGNMGDVSPPAFTVDTNLLNLMEVTAIPTLANNETPSYTFTANKAGTILYSGDCSSDTGTAVAGSNTIVFKTLAEGEYSNCVITVTDADGVTFSLNVPTFSIDLTPPVISLNGNDRISLAQGESYSDSGATATDNIDGDITADIVVVGNAIDTNAIDTNVIGISFITYDVSDAAGNVASQVTRRIEIRPPAPSGLTAVATGNANEVIISWDSVANASYYQLAYTSDATLATDGVDINVLDFPVFAPALTTPISNTNSTTINLSGLGGATFYYVVVASVEDAASLTSAVAVAATAHSFVFDTVTSATGELWMDRNLGASQVATSSTDTASYGDLYQWGRLADGHQIRTSGTSRTIPASIVPADSNFIDVVNDWTSVDTDGALRSAFLSKIDGSGVCPTGFRVPTSAELTAERLTWSSKDSAGAFASNLKLPVAGSRFLLDLEFVSSIGYLWSSSNTIDNATFMVYDSDGAGNSNGNSRSAAYSMRCIKD